MEIPFVDLKAQYASVKAEVNGAIRRVLEETAFIGGKYVTEFENEFARMYNVKHCIGVANGTDAIYIVLKMLGIGAGDEVITVANSWISTSETISQTGAKPVFIDVDDYYTIDADKIESKITPKTKAIIPVHLYGQPAEMSKIKAICDKHKLLLVEDCAQSQFSMFDEKFAGTFGIASTFSFYPGKNLGAYGDAGAILTNDSALAEKIRAYANHGSLKKNHHLMEGINSRLDGIQAAILSVKLKYIHEWNKKRNAHALVYNELLKDTDGITIPKVRPNVFHIFHLYVIRTKKREELQKYLKEHGVDTGIHYPAALPLMEAYSYLKHTASEFPVSAANQSEILSLPMFPELERQHIDYIVSLIKNLKN